ncbi:hypothetical protein MKZ38_010430 [Zalerion maritima]|uniref:Oleate hydratase n=1 Tax=Zalerion maritima TaxID=339359 RepID=A0AAD5RU55_9PEZI|nr:hypothetical protein MKZ38_010430 [Zalerion maritima]
MDGKSPAKVVLSLGLHEADQAMAENTEGPKQQGRSRIGKRDPQDTHVYLIGGGIASLVATVHLIHDAEVPAKQVHIIEAANKAGGAMSSVNSAEKGYSIRGTRKLNFTYHCLYDTLSKVPSGKDGRTILQEINSFNKYFNSPSHHKSTGGNPIRLVAATDSGPRIVDATKLNLEGGDKVKLLELLLKEESDIGDEEIQHCFSPRFCESLFWDLWCTMYGFQPWHSAKEFRRYLHRFLHEFPNLQNMAGVERTPMNDFESVILPLEKYLVDLGVDFRYGITVESLEFNKESGDEICVSKLNTKVAGTTNAAIDVRPQDIVLTTLGSMVSDCKVGSNVEQPPPMPKQAEITENLSLVWKLWTDLANPELNRHAAAFGDPANFYSRVANSNWLCFTVTLKNTDFMKRLGDWAGGQRDSYPLVTFRDSPWLVSITIPNQPYFLGQPKETVVLWGYGLFPDQDGTYAKKPMTKCSGQDIFKEVLGHLGFPTSPILDRSITIPVFMPFIGSPFVTRKEGDRPQVVPEKSVNLGLMGQFVEMERDVTFTMEYSARSAQTAVYALMGLDKAPHQVYRGDHSVKVLGEALKAIMG